MKNGEVSQVTFEISIYDCENFAHQVSLLVTAWYVSSVDSWRGDAYAKQASQQATMGADRWT